MATEVVPRYFIGFRRLRYLMNWCAVVAVTVVLGTFGLAASLIDPGGGLTLGVARNWARSLLAVGGIRIRVTGLERLDPGGGYVFVANHSSGIDIPALLIGLPYRLKMLAKASLFSIPFLGWYIRRIGYIPVHRSRPLEARRVLRNALDGAGRGASIVVFPEGTRTPEGEIGEFKRGAVLVARTAGLPIVPVAIVNAGLLLPRGGICIDPGVVDIRIGEPLVPAPTESARRLAAALRERVEHLRVSDRLR